MKHLTADWPEADYTAIFEGIEPSDNLHDGVRAVIAARLSRLFEVEIALQEGFPEPNFNPAWKMPLRDFVAGAALGVAALTVNRAKSVLKRASAEEIAMLIAGEVDLFTLWEALPAKRKVMPRGRKKKDKVKRPKAEISFEPRKPTLTLKPEDVDPEFKGSAIEFVDKYGHVQTETAEHRARRRFGEWAGAMRSLAKLVEKLDWPVVDEGWLRSPHTTDVLKLSKAIDTVLVPLDRAMDLLKAAEKAISKKDETE